MLCGFDADSDTTASDRHHPCPERHGLPKPEAKNTEGESTETEDDFLLRVMHGQAEILLSPYKKGFLSGVHKRDGKFVPRRSRRSVLAEFVG